MNDDLIIAPPPYAEDIEDGIARARARGPVATCGHLFHDGEHKVEFKFHCRKDCRWFTSETSDFGQCDWRSVDEPGCCCHWLAQLEALRFLADAATKEADELEEDL